MTGSEWAARYEALAERFPLPPAAADDGAGLFLCGMSTVVDARVDLSDPRAIETLTAADAPAGARALADLLLQRVARGIGGEVRVDWPDGPAFLRGRLAIRHALGGTGAQAAMVLTQLGARALVALEDRSRVMLPVIPAGILVAAGDGLVEARGLAPTREPVAEIYIFEYTAGRPVGSVTPTRSSRVIVRFEDRGIQHDPDFEALSVRFAPRAAAGLVSGLNDEPVGNVDAASRHVFALTRAWRQAGLAVIHLELAGYVSQKAVATVLANARGAVTSLGMSPSELLALIPGADDPLAALQDLAERFALDRVCVHADGWAASVTTGDPAVELDALMTGCAAASARAAAGRPVPRPSPDPLARYEPLPFSGSRPAGRGRFVACPAPYLEAPATTLGLGDSFTAGCLLVLGRPEARAGAGARLPATTES